MTSDVRTRQEFRRWLRRARASFAPGAPRTGTLCIDESEPRRPVRRADRPLN